jgi:hypothetical protein
MWARANLKFIQGVDVPFNSAEESAAIITWQKNQRVELLRTIAVVTATVNPDQAQRSLNLLVEEMFPESQIDKKESVEKALEIMESERKKVYRVTKSGQKKPATSRKIAKMFKNRN